MAVYLSPLGWLLIALAGMAGTLGAIGVARIAGSDVPQRPGARRLGLGIALFAPVPLLAGGVTGPIAAWLFLTVAGATLAKQSIGPLVAPGEGSAIPLGWGAAMTRGVAFATTALLAALLFLDAMTVLT